MFFSFLLSLPFSGPNLLLFSIGIFSSSFYFYLIHFLLFFGNFCFLGNILRFCLAIMEEVVSWIVFLTKNDKSWSRGNGYLLFCETLFAMKRLVSWFIGIMLMVNLWKLTTKKTILTIGENGILGLTLKIWLWCVLLWVLCF